MYRLLKKATLFVFTFALTALWTCEASIGLINPRKSLSTKYAVAGGSVDFDCRLKDPSLEVHLYHKDTKLLIDGVKYIQAGQCFTINNLTKSDSGDYKLQTVLPSGVKKNFMLRPLRVVVIGSLKVNTNVVPSSITALAGGSTLLTCRASVSGSLQFKSIMWYKDIKSLPSVLQNYSTNGNIHVNTLKLSNLETKDSGNYECRTTVTYYVGFWPAVAKLQVMDFKFTTAKRPDIFVGDVGSTLRISCETSDPNATVTLVVEKENSSLKPVIHDGLRIVKNGARFEIHRVTLEDGGKYICRAVSTHRRLISMNMGIFVPLQGGHKNPKAHITPFSQTLNLGEDFNFTCKAFGDAIHITWLKNGKPVPPNMVATLPAQTYKGYTLFEAVLMIRGARKSDESKYTCQITNTRQPGYYHNVTANLTIYECLKPDGKFRDPFNSGGYIDCNHDKATMKLCLYSGQFWEDSLKRCVFPATTPTTPFLRWVVTKYDRLKSVPVGSSYTFDCRLTVSTVPVKLKRDGLILKDDGTKVIRTGQVFLVSNLVMGIDAGAYVCSAPGIVDSKREQLYVDQDLTLTLSVRLRPSYRIVLDTTFTQEIHCQSYHLGKIHWYKVDPITHALTLITKGTSENDVIQGGYLETRSVLTLTSVTQKDAGTYMCRKNNSVQAVASETIVVKVKAPVRPVVRPISQKTTLEHRTLVIKSSVSGSPLPDVTWHKGHKLLVTCSGGQLKTCQSHDKNYRAKWNRNAQTGLSLTIVKTAYPADDGVFLLEVKNIAGSARAKSNVSVIVPPEIKRRGNQIIQKIIRKDSSDQLTCEVTRANPAPIFSWQYQQWPCDVTIQSKCKPLPNNWQQMPSRLARVKKALSTPMKSVLEVLPSKKLAYYRCRATNKLKTRRDTLVFAVMRTDEGSDLLVIKGKSTRYLNEHANITMTCTGHSVFSAPPYWLDPEGRRVRDSPRTRIIVNSSPLQNTTALTLIGAQVNDSGKYTCVAAQKKTGTMSVSTVLKVLAVSSPAIIMSNQTVKETNNVMVNCTVSGHPRPDITWYKDGKPLELRLDISSPSKCSYRQNGFYHLKTIDSNPMTFSLVVCKAEYVNSGWYRCVATNNMGADDQRAYLDILASPRIQVTPGPRKEGEPFRVQCLATGNPTPYVRWLKENDHGIFVAMRNASSWRLGSSSMFFPIVGDEDYGKYRCVARNMLGERYSNYSLTVPPVSSKIVTGQSGTVSRPALTAIIVSGALVILLLLGIIAVLYRRKKLYGGFYILTLPPSPDYIQRLDPCRSLQEQIHKLPLSADWEFSRDRLTLGKIIGSGAFGQVYRADAVGIVAFDPRRSIKGKSARRRSRFGSARSPYYNNKQVTVVACKGLKEDATESEFRDLVSELKILMHIGEHKNIVNLLGACTKGRQCDLLVIIEFCPHGNLLEFLRNRRDNFEPEWSPATEKPDEIFSVTDLVITAFQVSRAMEFLASRRCVHRDLAARNVLVGENHVMKVADFGLARDIYKDEHYVKTTAGLLPVKWMAIEALVDRIYTHQSDVWSFGVLLWEIFTLGGSPYPGLPANEVYQYLMEGQRMNLPHDCPEEMYALMLNCWQHDPNERLQFSAILQTVDKLLEEKTTQTGEEYLELENEIPDLNENQPYYLQPEDIHPSSPPDTPRTFNAQSPFLPPLPYEEIEMESLIKKDPVQDDSIKKGFVLGGVPKKRRNAHGSDDEIEKACADTMETERQKKSDSSGFASGDDDFLSEKEHLMKDYEQDKDICERNSGVFDDSPSPYINTVQPYSNANGFKYGDDGACKKNGEARPRQQSARYV